MLTAFTSSSLTADQIISPNEWRDAIYSTPKYKSVFLQLIINIYGAQLALAAVAGLIGKPIIESRGWSTPELHAANFVQTMTAGNAVLNLATILGMNLLAYKVDDYSLSQNMATFVFGLPFNTVMGAFYGLAGAGMQHLLTDKEEMAFAAAAGATGTAIAYLALAIATRARPLTFPGITSNNFIAARTFIPLFLLGHQSTFDSITDLRYADFSEKIQLLIALYAMNLIISATGGAIGQGIMSNTRWQDPESDTAKFVEAMLIGAAIFSSLTNFLMFFCSEKLVYKNKMSQNVATFGIGVPIYAFMGATYALVGCGMQGSLKNPNAVAFAATAGAVGNSLAYTLSALLMDGRGALRRACTPAEIPGSDNCFLKMYKRSCCINKHKATIENDEEQASVSERLLVNGPS